MGRDLERYEVLGDRRSIELTYPPAGAASRAALFSYETGEPKELLGNSPDSFAANDPNGLTERGFLPQLAHFLQAGAVDSSTENRLCTRAEAYDAADTAVLKKAAHGHKTVRKGDWPQGAGP